MIVSTFDSFVERNVEWWLRWAFAIVYVWFGALKPLGISPALELVEHSLGWISLVAVVPMLGYWEILIGLMFLVPRLTKITLIMFVMHMLGTFIPMFFLVSDSYTAWPHGLTLVGQYIVKNLVFLAAGGALWKLWRRTITYSSK